MKRSWIIIILILFVAVAVGIFFFFRSRMTTSTTSEPGGAGPIAESYTSPDQDTTPGEGLVAAVPSTDATPEQEAVIQAPLTTADFPTDYPTYDPEDPEQGFTYTAEESIPVESVTASPTGDVATIPETPPLSQSSPLLDGSADADADGLTNDQERQLGTNPQNPDTDGDGLSDNDEARTYRTDPRNADTDGDDLSDGDEINRWKTDPLNPDTDGDGYPDATEIKAGYNPNGPGRL